MNSHKLDTSSSFTQLGLSISSDLTWEPNIHSIAKHTSQKLGFLSRACGYFSPQLVTIYKSQICPSLNYCSHVSGGAPKPAFHLLDSSTVNYMQIPDSSSLKLSLSSTIQTSPILYSLSLSNCHLVADLSIFHCYFHGHCSLEIRNIIPDPVRCV